ATALSTLDTSVGHPASSVPGTEVPTAGGKRDDSMAPGASPGGGTGNALSSTCPAISQSASFSSPWAQSTPLRLDTSPRSGPAAPLARGLQAPEIRTIAG